MKSPVSIALFFLLSGFFLSILLGAIEHSAKLLVVSGACLAAVVCIIVFLTPVEWPSWHLGWGDDDDEAPVTATTARATGGGSTVTTGSSASTATSSTTTSGSTTSTTLRISVTTEVPIGSRY